MDNLQCKQRIVWDYPIHLRRNDQFTTTINGTSVSSNTLDDQMNTMMQFYTNVCMFLDWVDLFASLQYNAYV